MYAALIEGKPNSQAFWITGLCM